MLKTEKILFDTLNLNFKILKANWESLEQNPPNKKAISQAVSNIQKIIDTWENQNEIVNKYALNYKENKKRRKQLCT